MLHRKTDSGIFVISQPAHSWVSGQLARAWGNSQFHQPAEAVIMAAALHDIGFLEWEHNPTLNPETGWPYSFLELPTHLHLQLWEKGIQELLPMNRYAALLVSLHYTGLTERHPSEAEPDRHRQKYFRQQQQQLQAALAAAVAEGAHLDVDRRLVGLWDWMSLILGLREATKVTIPDVPSRSTPVQLVLEEHAPGKVRVTPWPFREASVRVCFQSRFLGERFRDEGAMRAALRDAPVQDLPIELTP